MDEIILGLSLSAIVVFLLRFIFGWSSYRRSIHKVIYSCYLEYYSKKKRIRKLSESAALEEDFGKHKVLYQFFSNNGAKLPKPYIIVILSSGIYCLKVSNTPGEIYGANTGNWESIVSYDKKHPDKRMKEKMVNPIIELEQFSKKLQEKIIKIKTPVYKIVVFPDKSTLKTKDEEIGNAYVIRRSQLHDTLINIHKSKEMILCDWEIDALWEMMAGDSLKLEENKVLLNKKKQEIENYMPNNNI
ncbi:nuclease-related domain-containing protein [Clostridium omnivorum]|uniref:NERD domain-containing protein n=1 Tax=Clostridium omnivorum TaxID=1604902 RepID=A0ABQ5N334_9CLOT|nr:nuclease-related domain-containing protein [Clostridium sp. E14]GLC29571.1 hypothetical protein bsdE14_09810 [Clostridium sp. E14]